MLRPEVAQHILSTAYGIGGVTLSDMARELEKMLRHDPERAARSVGTLYGQVFKRKEAALNPWMPPEK